MTPIELLEEIISFCGLEDLAQEERKVNNYSYQEALKLIAEFLERDDISDPIESFSDTIYVPGGAGVVRVQLEHKENGVFMRNTQGSLEEFHLPNKKRNNQAIANHKKL